MNQLLQNSRNGEFSVTSTPEPALRPEGLLVRTAKSLISAGTEKTSVSTAKASLVGKARSRPDLVRQVVQHAQRQGVLETVHLVRERIQVPMQLGYACAGVVTELGSSVQDLEVGDRVACAGAGFAAHAEVNYIPNNLAVKLPDRVSFAQGAYATLGAIALQGVRQSGAVVGDKVAVIGLGLIGQLTVQILKAAGCQVLGVDISDFAVHAALGPSLANLSLEGSSPERGVGAETEEARGAQNKLTSLHGSTPLTMKNGHLQAAEPAASCWADLACNSKTSDVPSEAKAFSHGYGVDKVIITAASKDNQPLLQAGEMIRDRGTIVIVGAVPVNIPRSPFYEKEIEIKFSRSSGPGRYDSEYEEKGHDYPIGYVRWTERRNMEAFLQLVAAGKINLEHLTTHRFKLRDAPKAYEMILQGSEPYLGIVIDYDYPGHGEKTNGQLMSKNGHYPEVTCESAPGGHSSTAIGFIGAGKFAQGFLLPHIKGQEEAWLKTVVNSSGVTAERARTKNGFQHAGTNPQEIFEDEAINTVFIASRHNSHADYVLKAARAGKHVFVEKPLCLCREELKEIEATYSGLNDSSEAVTSSVFHPLTSVLMVGYNRRFAPSSLALKHALSGRTRPLSILYRVNAGLIDRKHWIQDLEIGGGRILGEVCHFIDYAIFLAGSRVTSVYATSARYNRVDILNEDTVHINLTFADGSVAVIQYICDGDRAVAKEWIEVMVDQTTFQIRDFRSGFIHRNGKRIKLPGSSRRQNKGHAGEVQAFFEAIKAGGPAPIDMQEIFHGMDVTFLVRESLGSGQVMRVGQALTEDVITVKSEREKMSNSRSVGVKD